MSPCAAVPPTAEANGFTMPPTTASNPAAQSAGPRAAALTVAPVGTAPSANRPNGGAAPPPPAYEKRPPAIDPRGCGLVNRHSGRPTPTGRTVSNGVYRGASAHRPMANP